MRRVRACAAIAAWISVMFLLSACSIIELFAPPPLEAVPPSQPPLPPQARSTKILRGPQRRSRSVSWFLGNTAI